MKNREQKTAGSWTGRGETGAGEVISQFGEAVLVRMDGRIVLRGGSMADRTEALEWLSMFMPEAVATLK
ncbi:MAG TPA: hypothetical protein VJS65_10455 [Verrucomicrobiae bacterium]|nr:hypothetical protein [Verrucomicrobiae bacterium]